MADPADAVPAVSRYPLEWPLGWRRAARRQHASFSTRRTTNRLLTVLLASERLEAELQRLGARAPVLSTNVTLRLDGRPRSDEEPKDPGAAVYFTFKGRATVLGCDCWLRVADNIAALAAHVNAVRRIDRYGVGTIEQAMAGYKALPADTAADWRAVLGFAKGQMITIDQITDRFKELARLKHPDVIGGSEGDWLHLQRARDYAVSEIGEAR